MWLAAAGCRGSISHHVHDPTALFEGVRVLPVLTIERAAVAVPLARALVPGGLKVIEVTLRTAVALDAVRAIAREVPEAVVGVGTVTAAADIRPAIDAGARYLVSPGTPSALADALRARERARRAGLRHGRRGDGALRTRLQRAEILSR